MIARTGPVEVLGIPLIGINAETGYKLALTLGVVLAGWLVSRLVRSALRSFGRGGGRAAFWTRQAVSLLIAALVVIGLLSIWFDDPARLGTAFGLVTAGIAFALQRVITSVAGYFVILRGKTFNVGDRIVMGGVRGDVISLSFMQTKIMEMGEPPSVQGADPAVWVHSRQFTGRICTVTNDKIFDEPVYNYTYHFPYIWDEIRLPVRYPDDRARAEEILLKAARDHAITVDKIAPHDLAELDRRYNLSHLEIEPRVYWRITDNWLELAVRFLTPDHGTRGIKDQMSRDILAALDAAGIGIASATYEITDVPALRIEGSATPQA